MARALQCGRVQRLCVDTATRLESPRELADGTMRYSAILSRAGVLEYGTPGTPGYSRQYRPESEVFSADSMRSFEGMAFTDYHPTDSRGNPIAVDLHNRSKLQWGYVVPGSLRRDGNALIGDIHVTDPRALLAIKNGRTEISLGYFQTTIPETGTAPEDGLTYTHRQTGILGNHCALVDRGRAGIAHLQIDQQEDITMTLEQALKEKHEAEMRASKAEMRADAAEKDLASTKSALGKAEAERDTLKEAAQKADQLRIDGEKSAMTRARARIELEARASKILTVDGAAPSLEAKTDRQIREEVISRLSGKPLPAGKDDSYVEARFDALIELAETSDAAAKANQSAVRAVALAQAQSVTTDSAPKPGAAYKAHVEREANAWQSKKS